jgi:O-acetyl-ADP-ribose deacetylase (regulator of RNase III)
MGSYREIKGDLLDLFDKVEFNTIAHGCNCMSTMGAGIAKQIANKFPDAKYADKYSNLRPWQKYGNLTIAEVKQGDIINLYTQFNPGPNADLTAIRMSLRKLNYLYPIGKIGLPLIGCGIGGLDWETQVKPIVQEELKDMDVTVVHYDKSS